MKTYDLCEYMGSIWIKILPKSAISVLNIWFVDVIKVVWKMEVATLSLQEPGAHICEGLWVLKH